MGTVTLLLRAVVFFNWRVTKCIIFVWATPYPFFYSPDFLMKLNIFLAKKHSQAALDSLQHLIFQLATWGWPQNSLEIVLALLLHTGHTYCCLTSQQKLQISIQFNIIFFLNMWENLSFSVPFLLLYFLLTFLVLFLLSNLSGLYNQVGEYTTWLQRCGAVIVRKSGFCSCSSA